MPTRPQRVNPPPGLTAAKSLPYRAIRMRHLNAIAATSTVRFWWRGLTIAARWRD